MSDIQFKELIATLEERNNLLADLVTATEEQNEILKQITKEINPSFEKHKGEN